MASVGEPDTVEIVVVPGSGPMVILDAAGMKGTGTWTVQSALDLDTAGYS